MTRIYLSLVILAPVILAASWAASAATIPRIERGNLVLDNVPEVPADLANRLDAYLEGRDAVPLGFSPKGQLLISTRFGEVNQLHLIDAPLADRRQITFLRDPITWAAFSPDPTRVAYVYAKDVGGGGNVQLYYQRGGDTGAKLLTDGKSRNGAAVWSNNGREIAFFSTARDGASHDIDVVEPESAVLPRLIVTGDGADWIPLDWSPDDRKLLVRRSVSRWESSLYVVDLATGQKRELDPAPVKVGIAGGRFSRDGQGVYYISDRDGEFAKLRYLNLFTGDKAILSGNVPWDVTALALARDGHYLAYVTNEAGIDKLNLIDLHTHQDLTPPRLPGAGVIDMLSFDAQGTHLAFGFASPTQPGDAYVLDLASNQVEAWSRSEAGAVDATKFVVPRLARFPTFDRPDGRARELPVYLYEPGKPGPHPVLVVFHDGPDAQFRPSFDPWLQFVVNELGFTVAAPNLRGSSGYGKSFAALDNGSQRDDVIKDVGALIVWLGLQSGVDAKRIVVSGSDYGGYLALAALANYNDRLAGAVTFAGMGDLVTFLTGTAPYDQARQRGEYGDERDPETRAFLRRVSPLSNADRMTKPLLVVQGRNDTQVPASEAEQLVNRLRGRNGEVWYLQARDEGHPFGKRSNRDAYLATFASFLTGVH